MSDITTTLNNCKVEGNIIKLPAGQLERPMYLKIKKALELIGGKWKGHKVQGFVYAEDPTDLLFQLQQGENVNLKKDYQFFATPADLAQRMAIEAEIKAYDTVLEPSAGQGAIIKAIQFEYPGTKVYCYEKMPINITFIEDIPDVCFLGEDFLEKTLIKQQIKFSVIIANPPFSKNQDIDHIREMYDCLLPGGRLVTLSSLHWITANDKKSKAFKLWIEESGAFYEKIAANTFKDSGTSIETVLIVLDKAV